MTAYGDLAAVELSPPLIALVAQLEGALNAAGDPLAPEFRDGIVAALPHLRAFAISLTRNWDWPTTAFRPPSSRL